MLKQNIRGSPILQCLEEKWPDQAMLAPPPLSLTSLDVSSKAAYLQLFSCRVGNDRTISCDNL